MNELLNLLKNYDQAIYEELKSLLLEEEVIEKSILARASSYNHGLLEAAKERLKFLESIEKYFNFSNEASNLYSNKFSSAEFEVQIADKRLKEQQERIKQYSNRHTKSPAQLLYQKLDYEFNQYQLGIKSYDETISRFGELTNNLNPKDVDLVNIRDNFSIKLNHAADGIKKDESRRINELELSLYRKVQNYRMGLLSFSQYKSALEEYVLAGSSASEKDHIGGYEKVQINIGNTAESLLAKLKFSSLRKKEKEEQEEFKTEQKLNLLKLSLIADEEVKKIQQIEHVHKEKLHFINLEVKNEKEKTNLIQQLNNNLQQELSKQRLQSSFAFQSILSTSKSAFQAMWSNLIIGQRQAKDEWDRLWLDMKNSALKRIAELLEDQLMNYLFDLFIQFGLGETGSFLIGANPVSLGSSAIVNSINDSVVLNKSISNSIVNRLDNLEQAILNKSWSIKGEDIYTINKKVSDRRVSNSF